MQYHNEFSNIHGILLPKLFANAVTALSVLSILVVAVTGSRIYSQFVVLHQIIFIPMILIFSYFMILAAVRKRPGSFTLLGGYLVFVVTSILAVLHYQHIIVLGDYASLGLLVFVFSQAFILAKNYSGAFRDVEKMVAVSEQAKERISKTLDTVRSSSVDITLLVEAMGGKTEQLNHISMVVSTSMDEMTAGLDRQTDSVQKSVHTLDGLVSKFEVVVNKSRNVQNTAKDMQRISQEGNAVMQSMSSQIALIEASVSELSREIANVSRSGRQINDIVSMLKQISSKTGLLSINASIEAAKAGAAGRGFSVVAHEVQKLAMLSEEYGRQIQGIVADILKSVDRTAAKTETGVEVTKRGVAVTREAITAFEELMVRIAGIERQEDEMSAQSESLLEEAKRIYDAFHNISGVGEENLAAVEQVNTQSRDQLSHVKETRQALDMIATTVRRLEQELE